MRRLIPLSVPLLFMTAAFTEAIYSDEKIHVKVVVATMFEPGEARGDTPGELQFWVEGLNMRNQLPFPQGERDLFLDDRGVLAVQLGGGTSNATASVMALGLDPRFDLSEAYWLITGIAGGDPADISLASAAWANHVVDGDLLYEIDGREIPEHWPYGLIPLGAKEPMQKPGKKGNAWRLETIAFALNPQLVSWAFSLTRHLKPEGSEAIKLARERYVDLPAARRPPFVTIGDTLSASTYWHGRLLNQWANDWVQLYQGKDANFMTSNMEDSGSLTALHRLARTGLVDVNRVLVLRTVSNYTQPPKGKSAVWSRTAPYPDSGLPALKAAFLVGNTVVQALLEGWSEFQHTTPGN